MKNTKEENAVGKGQKTIAKEIVSGRVVRKGLLDTALGIIS